MLVENYIVATNNLLKSSQSATSKNEGIFIYELQPESTLRTKFKNSSTSVNALATSSTHIFAAQTEKAVVHVYSREKQAQESTISFPARIHSLTLIGDEVLVLGTADGRLILWELSTGRLISTVTAHLQIVSCVAAKKSHLISGSDDSNLHVWSTPQLLSLSENQSLEPIRSLSNHQAPITSLVLGNSESNNDICVSASKENTVLVWNYNSGQLLRTFLLSNTPLCLSLDPCDRGVYIGLDDGSIQLIEFVVSDSNKNLLFDSALQATPLKITAPQWNVPGDAGSALCICLTYDGTYLLTGHTSGKINKWDTGRRRFLLEVSSLTEPVTNLIFQSPFPTNKRTRISTVVKPKLSSHDHVLTTQFIGSLHSEFDHAVFSQGFSTELINDAIARFTSPSCSSSEADEQLKNENEALWKIINELRAVQKKTWEKYTTLQAGDT